ncbi:hypothetical protein MUK42_34135 [Musa troglodytarum]|uniref:Uncharacterized protein n=1 Tax=Musa troglodytarum TaxID=320322 RepID=A0A9E7GFF6_9LILI|nr:hypothetical protein MUK42_34135 [Musa troglodytarum]
MKRTQPRYPLESEGFQLLPRILFCSFRNRLQWNSVKTETEEGALHRERQWRRAVNCAAAGFPVRWQSVTWNRNTSSFSGSWDIALALLSDYLNSVSWLLLLIASPFCVMIEGESIVRGKAMNASVKKKVLTTMRRLT